MTIEEYVKKLIKLEEEGWELKERSEISVRTAEFLATESDKLSSKLDNKDIPYDDRNETEKQLIQIMKRMEIELRMIAEEEVKLEIYAEKVRKLEELYKQIKDS